MSYPTRKVLEGVPKVCFYDGTRCPEDTTFPSCLRAYLEYVGDTSYGCSHLGCAGPEKRTDCTNAFLMGTTGAAFKLSWDRSGWNPDNVALHYCSFDASEPFRRGLESVGYSFDMPCVYVEPYSEADFREKIIDSINKDRPVLAFGVVGPPETCLITGYDEGGEVLIGWSFFQGSPEFNAGVDFEPSGYFRKRNWFSETPSMIIVGDKGKEPPLRELYRDTLQYALKVMRTPENYSNRANGLTAFDAWCDALLRDEDFSTDDMSVLMERYMVHYDAVGTVAECRWYGSLFLGEIMKRFPETNDELSKAIECFVAEHDLMWAVWEFAGGNGASEAHAKKLADPGVRGRIVPLIKLSKKLDQEAAELIEKAAEILEVGG